ncbi:MAG: type II toxin-antitoxin system VapC family toxin [Spirochaetaceae bacterium]|nr:type II toxin-antitoxin system VapC family toxin [Spirochaetaceae bacterium]
MVIDTSAVMAILLGESDSDRIGRALLSDSRCIMSAFTALETSMVIEGRKGSAGGREWELLAFHAGIEFIPFTYSQQSLAIEAWRRYGKGNHPAALNIGDCCSYALAAHTGESLLFKGDDFTQTDISQVEW